MAVRRSTAGTEIRVRLDLIRDVDSAAILLAQWDFIELDEHDAAGSINESL